jgi:hypothetical protein
VSTQRANAKTKQKSSSVHRAKTTARPTLGSKPSKSSHLQPDDDRKGEVELFGCVDDSLGDDVALHNTAKDVNKDGFDLGVAWKKARWTLENTNHKEVCLKKIVTIAYSTKQLRAPCKILNASQTCLRRRRGWRGGAGKYKSAT